MPWSLELYQQANFRLNRLGQANANPVIIHRIITKKTVDERIAKTLSQKDAAQRQLLNDITPGAFRQSDDNDTRTVDTGGAQPTTTIINPHGNIIDELYDYIKENDITPGAFRQSDDNDTRTVDTGGAQPTTTIINPHGNIIDELYDYIKENISMITIHVLLIQEVHNQPLQSLIHMATLSMNCTITSKRTYLTIKFTIVPFVVSRIEMSMRICYDGYYRSKER